LAGLKAICLDYPQQEASFKRTNQEDIPASFDVV